MVKTLTGKMYYSISEAAAMVGVEAYVLRFWEKEFPQTKPRKNRAGNRIYKPSDIERVKRIKRLLHDDGYTIEGARNLLKREAGDAGADPRAEEVRDLLREIRIELEKIIKLLP
ncbi:MAG: MerR family transcriptional regulator [candidate division Zixibacteria bacterium]